MANPKLCEIIAVVSGKKGEVEKTVTDLYHKLQKPDLFDGLQRTYKPRTEDGEKLPGESKNPQLRVSDAVTEACGSWKELIDLVLTLDTGNCKAVGQIDAGSGLVINDVPVTTLLFLQKQLENVKAFITKLPTLDPAATWMADPAQNMYRTEPYSTARTKKVQKAIVKYPATEQHPAQTEMVTEDIIAGDWTQTNYSTRLTAREKSDMLARVGTLMVAVKTARERANTVEVQKRAIGESLLNYVFGK